MIYSMETKPGMSGGPVIDKIGNIIGIHGRGELNQFQSDYKDQIVKTRLNNGVPISYFISYLRGEETSYIPQEPKSIDDLNALTYREWRTKRDHGGEKGIKYTSLLIELLRELAVNDIGDNFCFMQLFIEDLISIYDLVATKRPFQISIKPLSLPTAISKEIYIVEEGCRFLKSQGKCF